MELLNMKNLVMDNIAHYQRTLQEEYGFLEKMNKKIMDTQLSMRIRMEFKQKKYRKQKLHYKRRKEIKKMRPPSSTPVIAGYWSNGHRR